MVELERRADIINAAHTNDATVDHQRLTIMPSVAPAVAVFDSPLCPPDGIEGIDIENRDLDLICEDMRKIQARCLT